jgi:hypothetical protein
MDECLAGAANFFVLLSKPIYFQDEDLVFNDDQKGTIHVLLWCPARIIWFFLAQFARLPEMMYRDYNAQKRTPLNLKIVTIAQLGEASD